MKYANAVIQVFCKAPVTGTVKTRLIPALGPDDARQVHEQLAARMLKECHEADLARMEVWTVDHADHPFFAPYDDVHLQMGADLGERMSNALSTALNEPDVDRAILTGTDCPGLDAAYLDRALVALKDHDAVIGPAEDGGYGLIGLRRPGRPFLTGMFTGIFTGIDWGTSEVCAQTCRKFNEAGLRWALLPLIWDVDRPEDLRRLSGLPGYNLPNETTWNIHE